MHATSVLTGLLTLNWTLCHGNVWCTLNDVNLSNPHFDNLHGVYIIWYGDINPSVIYIGQGNIRDRLMKHRNDQQIQKFKGQGLYVTWAKVAAPSRNGVERYLADTLYPFAGDSFPDVPPIKVNLPW